MIKRRLFIFLAVLALLIVNSAPRPTALAADSRTFPETGKTVSGKFLTYWTGHGGLAQQGYPISEEMNEVSDTDGKTYTVQYFERAVFELHPENAGKPSEVLLTLLGALLYNQKYPDGAEDQSVNTGNPRTFPETGKTIGGVFRTYWEQHGGLAQQGYPISNEFMETSDTDGQTYKVQYFERAVFEYHPENAGTPNQVLLSLLGTFRYNSKYGDTTEPIATPTPVTNTDPTATPTDTDPTATPTDIEPTATLPPPTPDTKILTKAGWTSAVATTNNILFLYNKADGTAATAKIGDDGTLTPLLAFPDPATHTLGIAPGYTNIVAVAGNNILLYSATSGSYHIMNISDTGAYSANIAVTIDPGWSVINGDLETGLLLYLNPANGLLAIDHIVANGKETAVTSHAAGTVNPIDISSASILVPVGLQTSKWLVYSKTNKVGTLAHVGADGAVTSVGSRWNFGPAWTNIVSDNGGHLVWYDNTNQIVIVTGYDANGDIAILGSYPGVSNQWAGLVGALNHVIIYFDHDGNIATDGVDANGIESSLQSYPAGQ